MLSATARQSLPRHVAIIMDGNGRWAEQRGLPRVEGHRNGIESVRDIVTATGELGIQYLTLYAFSLENWNRPKEEVDTLMEFLAHYMESESHVLKDNNVRLEAIGQLHRLPDSVRKRLEATREALSGNDGLTLVMALSYGGRSEILDAARRVAEEAVAGRLRVEDIDEKAFRHYLHTGDWPDPELLIRTSGEMRISNFLLWQTSYTEFVASPTLWPDFRRGHYFEALEEYARRNRRFGGV